MQTLLANVDGFITEKRHYEYFSNKNINLGYSLFCTGHRGKDIILEFTVTTYYKMGTMICQHTAP